MLFTRVENHWDWGQMPDKFGGEVSILHGDLQEIRDDVP
jgi:hypothetical protein